MRRRHLLLALLPFTARATDSWSTPKPCPTRPICPLCKTAVQDDQPELLPTAATVAGDAVQFPGMRDCFCPACGVRFIARP